MRHLVSLGAAVAVFIASQAFSGGLEPEKKEEAPKLAEPVRSVEPVKVEPVKTLEPIPVQPIPDDCKPKGGNSVVNHGSVTNGGDSVGTKVVCQCEPSNCEEKVKVKEVVKYVKSAPKIVEKKVPGPTRTVYKDRAVEKVVYVDKPVPGPTVYVDKPAGQTKTSQWSVGILAGAGPYGVHFYRYGEEYKAKVGKGILVGADVNYRFAEHYNVGAIYINNDTVMGRAAVSF